MKTITFGAVPAVIDHGKVLDTKRIAKAADEMALLSEKIRIEKGEFSGDYFVVITVKVAKDNRLYLHEVYQKKSEVIRRSRPGPSRKTVPPATLLPPLYTVYLKN